MPETPPYPNDSLRWVAAEIRYPMLDALTNEVPGALRSQLHELFPIREDQQQLTVSVGPGGPTAQQVPQGRFLRRDRLASVALTRDAVSLEMTDYPGWSVFRGVLATVLEALEQTERPDGVLRVGMRYIDEIRLPTPPGDFAEWRDWVDGRLLGPFTIANDPSLTGGVVVLQFGTGPGFVTIFRAAPFVSGRTVQVDGPLRAPFITAEGPYFLFDCDASWADPAGAVPEFGSAGILEVFDALHSSCHRLFESSITDKLRDEVLSRPREEMSQP